MRDAVPLEQDVAGCERDLLDNAFDQMAGFGPPRLERSYRTSWKIVISAVPCGVIWKSWLSAFSPFRARTVMSRW